MKRGYIQPGKSASELIRIIKQFEHHGVPINNVTINISFEEFIKTAGSGDIIIVDSYTEIFGSLTEIMSYMIELSEQHLKIESCTELSLPFHPDNIEVLKAILTVSNKVRAFKTKEGLDKARSNGVKLGRPFGSTRVTIKVAQVNKLCRTQGMSISKACQEVGCNPRTYYRHTTTNKMSLE